MKKLILLAFMLIVNVFAGEMQEQACGDKSLSYCINHFDRQCKAKNYFACYVVGELHIEQEQYSQAKKYYEMVCDKANSKDSFQVELIGGSMGPKVPTITAMQVSCNYLGRFYYNGLGVKQNLSKAKELFSKSCDLGYQDGCNFYKGTKGEIAKCLGGDVNACEKVASITFNESRGIERWRNGGYANRIMKHVTCNDYMKAMRKGCNLGSGLCCALLGDELHPISVSSYGKWYPKYGENCSLRNQSEAFKYYKKACELGESAGCRRYTELQNDIDEIDSRERDKTHKGDITVRQK